MVANKPFCAQMYTITGSSNHYVAVACILCNSSKTISYSYHSRMIAIIATVANGAVRLSSVLRLVGFIHVAYFKKVMQINGHHKVESVAKIIIFE